MMKRLSKSIVVTLMLLIGAQSASAQTFSKMSETKRNAELVKMARKLYHSKFFADYYKNYRDNGKATVTVRKVKDNGKSEVTNGHEVGEVIYLVKLYSVANKKMGSINAVKVLISDKLGVPYLIQFDSDKKYNTRWNTPEAFK